MSWQQHRSEQIKTLSTIVTYKYPHEINSLIKLISSKCYFGVTAGSWSWLIKYLPKNEIIGLILVKNTKQYYIIIKNQSLTYGMQPLLDKLISLIQTQLTHDPILPYTLRVLPELSDNHVKSMSLSVEYIRQYIANLKKPRTYEDSHNHLIDKQWAKYKKIHEQVTEWCDSLLDLTLVVESERLGEMFQDFATSALEKIDNILDSVQKPLLMT